MAMLLPALATAGGAATAGTVAGATASVSLGSTLLTGLLTAASAFGQIRAGQQQQQLMNLQAQQAELNARLEEQKGRAQSLAIKNQLDRDLASQSAIFSARGTLQGEGSALAASDVSKANAAADIETAKTGAAFASESDRLRAAQYRAEGNAARVGGLFKAFDTVTSSRSFGNLTNRVFGPSFLDGVTK